MTINAKSGGAIKDIVVSFKRNAVYGAMLGIYAKAGGVYGRVDAATYPAKEFYFTDFAGLADNTLLRNLDGWAAYNSVSSTASARDLWKTASEKITAPLGDSATNPGTFVIGRDLASTDQVFRFRLSGLTSSGESFTVCLGATHQNNAICVSFGTSNNTTFNLFSVNKNVGGSVTLLGAPTSAIAVGSVIELRLIGRKLYVYDDGTPILNTAGYDIDTGGVFTKGTVAGFGTRRAAGIIVDDVYMAALAADVKVNATQVFWPGDVAAGGRSVALTGTYQGSLLALQYRVLNASTLAEVQTWAAMTGVTIGGGLWSASGFVTMSSISTNPEYVVEVRAANDTDATAKTNAFAVGIAVSQYGQSNANNRNGYGVFGATTAYTPANTCYVASLRSAGNSDWIRHSGSITSPGAQLSSILATFTGIPVGHVVVGWGGQPIDALTGESDPPNTGDSLFFDDLETLFAARNIAGYVYAWNWTQGEAEANSSFVVNETSYRSVFQTLMSKLRALGGRNAPIGVTIVGKSTTPNGPSVWGAMRAALFRLDDMDGVSISHNFVDTPMADDFHYTANGYLEANRRTALSLAKAMGYSTYDGRGPIITGATRSGATITLAVDLNGATSISGTGLNYYEVSTDDFATTKTISSAAVSGGNIVITLSADPGAAVKVRSFYSNSYGNSPNPAPVFAIGTYADATTIPVEPLFVPITSN